MKKPSKSICFRLGDESLHLLESRAAAVNLSRGEMARSIVVSSLALASIEEVAESIEKVQASVDAMSALLSKVEKRQAYLLFHVLTKVGNISEDEAKVIVRDHFLRSV
jgi:hypothetical protein